MGFMRDAYAELRKAHWPTREQTIRLTGLVVAISLLMAMLLGLADFVFSELFDIVVA
jgi:preprotein translocase subunit SecE